MTGILQFDTKHGVIFVEIDPAEAGGPLVAKGGSVPTTARGVGDVVVPATKSFDQAMSSLKAYAASLEDLIMGLDLTPKEVSVEIGLKLTGSVGFIIAKAGADTEMKVSLTWEPKPKPAAKPEPAA